MLSNRVPIDMVDINSQASPCHIEIQFSSDCSKLWVHMNGRTITRVYGIRHIEMTNAPKKAKTRRPAVLIDKGGA